MKKLKDVMGNPSGLDSWDNYAGVIPDDCWLAVYGRNRDSDTLTHCNWYAALAALGGEGEDVEIVCYEHWVCGWIEYLAVREGSLAAETAEEITSSLEVYPILDEEVFFESEAVAADETWRDCFDDQERLEYIRVHRDEFYFDSFSDLRAVVRGEHFSGYASELLC